MKAESNLKPIKKFEIENIINRKCEIIFYDNIKEISILDDEEKTYSYNLYRLKANYRDDLEKELNDDNEKYLKWLQLAKDTEYNELAENIRSKRDKLLTETDWTQMTDTALSKEKQEKYKKYRQALRDITEQSGFPYSVEWPTVS